MGNFTEMIIAFFALRAGHINVVKASLSGSIIGNLLLVLGLSLVAGGLRNPVQRFSRTTSSMNSTTLMIAVAALVMPAVFNLTLFGTLQHHDVKLQNLSLWTSGVLIALYLLNMFFIFRTHRASFAAPCQEQDEVSSRNFSHSSHCFARTRHSPDRRHERNPGWPDCSCHWRAGYDRTCLWRDRRCAGGQCRGKFHGRHHGPPQPYGRLHVHCNRREHPDCAFCRACIGFCLALPLDTRCRWYSTALKLPLSCSQC